MGPQLPRFTPLPSTWVLPSAPGQPTLTTPAQKPRNSLVLSITTFILLVKAALCNCISPQSYHYWTQFLCLGSIPDNMYDMIEGVQKFAARLATKQWNTSYNHLLAQLGCMAPSFNLMQAAEAIPVPPYFIWLATQSSPLPASYLILLLFSDTHITCLFTGLLPML